MLTLATVGGKVSAALFNAVAQMVNLQGQTLIIPNSVSGTGVSLATTGKVSFAAATSVSVVGCFTSTYDNYLIKLYVPQVTGNLGLNMVLRSGSTDSTAANYDAQLAGSTSTTASASEVLAGTSWAVGAATSAMHRSSIELEGPALAAATIGFASMFSTLNPATAASTTAVVTKGLQHRLPSAFDGFTLTASANAMTGNLRVYGWNNG